jgi:hypothetical protein
MSNWNHESAHCVPSMEHTTVIGCSGTPYPCPDISTVDHHIVRLYKRIEYAKPWLQELVQELWAEIDLLLDRRIWLQLNRAEVRDAH